MRIDAYNQICQIYRPDASVIQKNTQKAYGRDQYHMSESGKSYQVAKKSVQEAPDVRAEKVAELKNRIDTGNYYVSSEAFAEKILSDYEAFA